MLTTVTWVAAEQPRTRSVQPRNLEAKCRQIVIFTPHYLQPNERAQTLWCTNILSPSCYTFEITVQPGWSQLPRGTKTWPGIFQICPGQIEISYARGHLIKRGTWQLNLLNLQKTGFWFLHSCKSRFIVIISLCLTARAHLSAQVSLFRAQAQLLWPTGWFHCDWIDLSNMWQPLC